MSLDKIRLLAYKALYLIPSRDLGATMQSLISLGRAMGLSS